MGERRPTGPELVPAPALSPSAEDLTEVVALDGPAGSGKSTVARLVAHALGWRFVDTGATYRAVTLAVLRAGVDLTDHDAVAAVAAAAEVVLGVDPDVPAVLLGGEDVTGEIRGPAVTAAVSAVSAVPAVRAVLVDLQRRAIGGGRAVVEGRDIATVVAPRAAVKVYLDARPEVRARRRARDTHAGVSPSAAVAATADTPAEPAPLAPRQDLGGDAPPTEPSGPAVQTPSTTGHHHLEHQVLRSLERRDALDSQTNALRASDGAVHLDTSDLTLDEVVAVIVGWVRAAGLVTTRA